MKKYKKTVTVVIILIVALIMFASFFGASIKNSQGEKIGIIPDFKLGMEFGNKRVITATINNESSTVIYDSEGNVVEQEEGVEYTEEAGYKTEEIKVNADSVRTVENYKKEKEIIEERLKKNNITEYFINLNESTGKITIEIPENNEADSVQETISTISSFMLLDGETFETLLDESKLKEANVMYSQGNLEMAVFLQLEFNEEGTKKLQELNEIYVESETEQTNENGEVETVQTSKTAWVILNNQIIGQTVLPNIVYNDKIMLTFGVSSDNTELQEATKQANSSAILLNAGTSPIVYDFTNETQGSTISMEAMFTFLVCVGIVFIAAYVFMIIDFKAIGFIASYFQIGFLATLLLILRFTNVSITIEGIAGIIIAMLLQYLYTYIVLNSMNKEKEGMYKKSNLEFFLNSFPIYVIAVVFTFAKRVYISSFGMTIFWGIITIYVYNFVFTKFIYENLSRRSSNGNS